MYLDNSRTFKGTQLNTNVNIVNLLLKRSLINLQFFSEL